MVEVVVFVLDTKTGGADATIFTSAFDALVAVLVEAGEVIPHGLFPRVNVVTLMEVLKGLSEPANGFLVELVLVTLQVAKLSELLIALIKTAGERLCCCVDDLVCSDVTTLSKCLAAQLAAIRALASVTTLVCLEVTEL